MHEDLPYNRPLEKKDNRNITFELSYAWNCDKYHSFFLTNKYSLDTRENANKWPEVEGVGGVVQTGGGGGGGVWPLTPKNRQGDMGIS